MARLLTWAAAVSVAGVAVGELATWRVSRHPRASGPEGRCAVIVLSYRTGRSGRINSVQRWRTKIGVRTLGRFHDGWLIFSGGATRGASASEGAVMARYAISVLGVPEELVKVETRSRSTWENVQFSLPLAESAGHIAIASDPHAEKARRYVAQQRPDLAERLVRAADYRLLERWWLKGGTAANHLRLKASGGYGTAPAWAVTDNPGAPDVQGGFMTSMAQT